MVSDHGTAAHRLSTANAALAAGDLDGAVTGVRGLADSDGAVREQVRAVLDSVIGRAELHRDALVERSRLNAGAGDWVGAIKDAASAITAAPHDAEANALLSDHMASVGRLDEATMFSYEALKADPDNIGRYAALAQVMRRQKAFEAAEELLSAAVSLEPDSPTLVVRHMDVLVQLRRRPEAIAIGQAARKRFPNDVPLLRTLAAVLRMDERDAEALAVLHELQRIAPDDGFARHALATAETPTTETTTLPARVDPDYIRTVFQLLAPRYDDLMLGTRRYRAPALLSQAIKANSAGQDLRILDLGCGTGLCGLMVRDMAAVLKGIDLSPDMAEIARATHIYDMVEQGEVETALAADQERYDVVVAGDTLAYFGDVSPLLRQVKAHLVPGGLFVFSVEVTENDAPGRLTRAGSVAHGRSELRRLAESCGFAVVQWSPERLKVVDGRPISGVIGVLRAP